MTRDLKVFGEHTLDASLLKPDGWVLDAGCRDFAFARALVEQGCQVVAIDADVDVFKDTPRDGDLNTRLHTAAIALGATSGIAPFSLSRDPQARHLGVEPGVERRDVYVITLKMLMEQRQIDFWEAIKLDIEGSEYGILAEWPGPIARQVSVEFHEHVQPRPPGMYRAIMERMEKCDYELVQHEKTARHCCAPNFWDTLWVLK